MKRIILLTLNLLFVILTAQAGPSTKGTEFHFLFGPNLFTSGKEFDPQILVTTNESEPVNFWISWNKFIRHPRIRSNTTHTVSRGEVEIINIPHALSIDSNNLLAPDLGIKLQSQGGKELTVVGVNEQQASTDAFLVFPKIETKSKTYEYFALSVEKGPFSNIKSFFGFVTTEPDTKITITPVTTISTFFFIHFRLLRGRNYTATIPAAGTSVAGTATDDLSGTRIVSDKPLSFFTGHECGLIPSDKTSCDHLVEQVPPTETWGFKFFLVPLSTRSGDGYRILASRGGTECSVTCTDASLSETITLARPGDFRQLIYTTRYCSVECNRPVLIFQFCLGHSYDEVARSDPFAVMIPPVGQYSNDYDLAFFESKEVDTRGEQVVFEAWINIAIPAEYDPSGLRFNGSPLSSVSFVDVTCNDSEVCGRVAHYKPTSDTGSHKLEHIDPNARFTATVYGWERENTYGYIGGMNFDSIAAEIFCLKDRMSSASELDGTASFVITRSGSATDRSCIGYTVGDVSTQGAADYSTTSGECCFKAKQRETTCTIQLVVDSIAESDEVLRIELAPKTGQCVCEAPGTTTHITIKETVKSPVFAFEKDKYEANEAAGTVRIGVVKQSGDITSGESVTIDVTPRQGSGQIRGADPATEGVDYTSTTQQVVFQSSDSIQYVEIPITNDSVPERTEYFYADLAISAGSGSVGAPNTTTVCITEEVKSPVFAFEKDKYEVNETAGTVRIGVLKQSGDIISGESVTICVTPRQGSRQIRGADPATEGVDFTSYTQQVVFQSNDSIQYFSCPITIDSVLEKTEYFYVDMAICAGSGTVGAPNTTTVCITEEVEPPVFAFEKDKYEVNETAGTVRIGVVKQSGDIINGESVTICVTPIQGSGQMKGADPATEGVDYNSTTQQVVFQSSDSIQYVEIPITDDDVFERTEYFYADLAVSAGSGSVGALNTTTVFITEEVEPPMFAFEKDKYEVNETAGTVRIGVVKKSGDIISGESVTICVTPRQGSRQIKGADPASEGEDYTSTTQQVVFQSSDSIQYVEINITDDDIFERTEYFYADLAICAGSGSAWSPNTTTVCIIDPEEEFVCRRKKRSNSKMELPTVEASDVDNLKILIASLQEKVMLCESHAYCRYDGEIYPPGSVWTTKGLLCNCEQGTNIKCSNL